MRFGQVKETKIVLYNEGNDNTSISLAVASVQCKEF